ncbi:MAG TPA: DUF4124 domain-containing protein [Gallionellaceae bacterium]|nr:DUF4124 domain-containing protein [Gallionellaceae bacterium]
MLLVFALPLALSSMPAEAKLYKWVDQNGETHYGQTIPPEYADQKKVQINKEGMEVRQKPKAPAAPGKPAAPAQKTPEQIQQERYDNMLLATYANEGEIDDQRDRSLQLINARISGIQMQLKSAQDDLNGYKKEKAPARDVAQATRRVDALKAQLADAEADADKVKARYAADKKRYHELTANPPQQ